MIDDIDNQVSSAGETATMSSTAVTATTTTPELATTSESASALASLPINVEFVNYKDESQLADVMNLVLQDLSEPYSIFTYRYFLHRFPELCILAVHKETREPVGCVVGKVDKEDVLLHGETTKSSPIPTGYIGMLAVKSSQRRQGIGKALVRRVLERMKTMGCTSVTLETEVSNVTAQRLYQSAFGFVREELLVRYYLNWGDAYRLRLWF